MNTATLIYYEIGANKTANSKFLNLNVFKLIVYEII